MGLVVVIEGLGLVLEWGLRVVTEGFRVVEEWG